MPILLASQYYGKILGKARKQHYDVFLKRPRLSRSEKLLVYLNARWGMNGKMKQKLEVKSHA